MSTSQHPLILYASVLEPWTRLAMSAPGVINLRFSLLPWLSLRNPHKAADEINRMFVEKNDAWQETSMALLQLPMRLYTDTLVACMSTDPASALRNAMINNSQRVAQPATQRVNANRQRLSRPKRHAH